MPSLAVLAHLPPFLMRQRSRLKQDVVRNSHFAQVMESGEQKEIVTAFY